MSRVIVPGKRLVQDFEYQPEQKLPTTQPIAQYIRQSSDGQRKKNKQSTAMQDGDMHKRLLKMGWKETSIIPFDQDTGMSGTKRIDQREGMSELYSLIKNGKIGAVACYDPSRLFRDDTYVQSSTFVNLCHEHNIPVITWTRIYWTGEQENKDSLFVALMTAAKDLKTFIDRTYPAKMRAIEEDHSYGGHAVPVGYTLAEEEIEDGRVRKYYIPYEPHAALVRWLFTRYRELDGNLPRLLRELYISGFCFPPFDESVKKIPHVALDADAQGNFVIKRRLGLVSILTNHAYTGLYLFGGTVRMDAHQPIVSQSDFDYAFTRLSSTTLDGEKNEKRPTVNRSSYKTARKALLENWLFSGDAKMYPMVGTGVYIARSLVNGEMTTDLSVPIAHLDARVSATIRQLLLALEDRRALGLQDVLYSRLQALQAQQVQQAVSYAAQLQNVDKGIRKANLDKEISLEEEDVQGVREAVQKLKRLRADKAELEAKEKQANTEKSKIEECISLLDIALSRWEDLDFEHEQRFFRLLVERVNVIEATQHVLRIDIRLNEPFNCTVTQHMFRARGHNAPWAEEEIAALQRLYKGISRLEILQALPTRSWASIMQQANEIGLKRDTRTKSIGISDQLTYEDAMLLRKLGRSTDVSPWVVEKEMEAWVQAHKEEFADPLAHPNKDVIKMVLESRVALLRWTLETMAPEELSAIKDALENLSDINLDSSFSL